MICKKSQSFYRVIYDYCDSAVGDGVLIICDKRGSSLFHCHGKELVAVKILALQRDEELTFFYRSGVCRYSVYLYGRRENNGISLRYQSASDSLFYFFQSKHHALPSRSVTAVLACSTSSKCIVLSAKI